MPEPLGFSHLHPFCTVPLSDRLSVQSLLLTLLDPLKSFFSPLRARVRIPGATAVRFDQAASELEGFARPLWGLAALVAGGAEYADLQLWIDGIRAGTDPESLEFWGFPRDNDQRMVEMCPLGFTLAVVPQIWSALSEKERTNVEKWLGNSVNEKNMPNTNWLWFRVFANLGLKAVGGHFSQDRLDQDIRHLDTFYRGDGWSNDGPEGIHQMDYYSSSFAIHFLQLLYARLCPEDTERVQEFKKRAQLAALDLIYYYDPEGRAIPFGRSVGYRFAMVSFWGALAYADVKLPAPLTWGVVKGIVLRNLQWWQGQKDIWGVGGTLTLGYAYPNMYMTENYNSPGSPYWACLAFICLAVPPTHPFWTSPTLPLPSLSPVKPLPHPKHIISTFSGHHLLLSSGQACGYPMKATHAKYGAFAYSSFFAYSVPTGAFTLGQYALASQLGVSLDGGETWHTRRLCDTAVLECRDGVPVLVSKWRPCAGVTVRTLLIPPMHETHRWHLRVHYVSADTAIQTADGSFAVRNVSAQTGRALELFDSAVGEGTQPRVLGAYDDAASAEGWTAGKSGAFAVSHGAAGIKALEADSTRRAVLVDADPNTNLVESRSTIPTLLGEMHKGEKKWLVTAVYAQIAGQDAGVLEGWEKEPNIPEWLRAEMDSRV
ncbi:hypothetical protein TD95_001288 [Thielaviopsis punctulata]|uniref:DUF2264 domain-containing protein n=1 Tax=Thielaviopsis punctulata TaxID=72032 RepID=A0A0F4ZCA3_9PEZI|nr:hypothetical protein TD95_001288 [Thielaviopsis punctulata]